MGTPTEDGACRQRRGTACPSRWPPALPGEPRGWSWPGAAGREGAGEGEAAPSLSGACRVPRGSLLAGAGSPALSGEAGRASPPPRQPGWAEGYWSHAGRCLPLARLRCCPSLAGAPAAASGSPRLAGHARAVAMPPDLAVPAAVGYRCAMGTCAGSGGDSTFAHAAGSRLEGCAVVLRLPPGEQAGSRL